MAFQDIRKARNGFSREDIRTALLILVCVCILLALNLFLARVLPGGEWLYLRWSGARAFLFENLEPYSATVAERVQNLVYGRSAFSSEYGYVLNDPFYIVLLYSPLAVLPDFVSLFAHSASPQIDFSLARGVWMFFAESALISTVLFTLRLLEWQPPRWILVAILVFSLFGYYNLQSLISASPAVFLIFIYLSILLALRSFNDELAGGLLFLAAYQWEVGALFLLFILIFVIVNKRWGVFTGLGMALFVMFVVSFLTRPGWLIPYLRAVLSDWHRGISLNFTSILSFWLPDSNVPIRVIIFLLALLILTFEWIGAVQGHFRRIVWVAGLSLALTTLIGFPVFQSNHVALTPTFIMILMLALERWNRRQILTGMIVFATAILGPFGLYIAAITTQARVYTDLLTLLPPIFTIIALYWMRWFAVRSPRTWLDQVGLRK